MPRPVRTPRFVVPLLFAAAALTPAPSGGAPPKTKPAGGHAAPAPGAHNPFPVGPTREMPIFDPRWTSSTLYYSLVDKDKVMVEGDLVLGTEAEVLRRSWANAVNTARDAVGRAELMELMKTKFGEQAPNEIRRLAGLGPNALKAPDVAALRDEVERAVKAMRPIQNLRPAGPEPGDAQRQAAAVFAGAAREFRWPRGVIPYEDAGVPDPDKLARAMAHWETRTNQVIRFVKRTPRNAAEHPDYVRFEWGLRYCFAFTIGRKPGTGAHRVTLEDACEVPQIIHELGHVVGLLHEHCRTDRDRWITIDKANMLENARPQFAMIGWKEGESLTPFDFDSIMLYPYKAFADKVDGAPTIRIRNDAVAGGGVRPPADPSTFGLATGDYGGKTTTLSELDVVGVTKIYAEGL